MKIEDSLEYISLTTTISELNKIGETSLSNKLLNILTHNELPKLDKHNRKDDKTTSYFEIKISEEEKEKILDLFYYLEVGHLTDDGDTTPTASNYSDMAARWASIKPTT